MKCDSATCVSGLQTTTPTSTFLSFFLSCEIHLKHHPSMATLSFTPTRIRTPNPFPSPKPISSNFIIARSVSIHPSSSSSSSSNTLLHQISHTSIIKPPPPHHHHRLLAPNSVSESSVSAPAGAGLVGGDELLDSDDPTVELSYVDQDVDPESILEWELDFCSRPILDIRGKKLWELVVCDYSLSLQYTKYFPNNVINSITLKDAIVNISDELGIPLPQKIRYFRSQMQTIITKACKELGIKPVPSKRCVTLLLWLEERFETIYARHPGFQKGSKPLLTLDNPFPMELPENLYGEKWAFVQLPYSAVQEEVSSLKTRFVFGAGLDLDLLGIEIDENTMIPGLAVSSSRAQPLAAWMNGLELCSIEADTARAALILSVGISTRYTYANYKKTPVTTSEAEAWEAAKKACGGLHFLAIQDDLNSDNCVGFWLLLDLPPPPV